MNRTVKRMLKKGIEKTAIFILIYIVICLVGFTVSSIVSWIIEGFTRQSILDELLQIKSAKIGFFLLMGILTVSLFKEQINEI